MPTTRAKKRTAPEIIRDRLGDRLSGLYVVTRDPVSGERYDPFGLVAVVEMDLGRCSKSVIHTRNHPARLTLKGDSMRFNNGVRPKIPPF
jgi:hypothetical protein